MRFQVGCYEVAGEDSFRIFFLALNLRTFHKLAHLLFVHQRLVRLLLSS
jgi:hypothetical protein